jgi:hypothetical protein
MTHLAAFLRAFVLGAPLACALACESGDGGTHLDGGRADADADFERDAAPEAGTAQDAGADAAPSPETCQVTAPTTCPDRSPRYADVKPVFAQYCSGCHNGRDGMWPLSSYQHVADWYGEIRGQLLVCTMPPPASGVVLPRAERELILTWIRCGFPN